MTLILNTVRYPESSRFRGKVSQPYRHLPLNLDLLQKKFLRSDNKPIDLITQSISPTFKTSRTKYLVSAGRKLANVPLGKSIQGQSLLCLGHQWLPAIKTEERIPFFLPTTGSQKARASWKHIVDFCISSGPPLKIPGSSNHGF